MTSEEEVPIQLADIPRSVIDEVREKLWTFTVSVFAAEADHPAYRGTATCITVGGFPHLLTAAHVWNSLRGGRCALSLDADRLLTPIWHDLVQPTVLLGEGPAEWGPDLALVRLPDVVASDIRVVKAFYNLDRHMPDYDLPAQYDSGLWAVIGVPAEQSTFGETEAVLRLTVFASWIDGAMTRDGFDYVDLAYDREGRPEIPTSFGGISGSGLWQVPLVKSTSTGAISWSEVHLEGVAFYQKPAARRQGVIRCHGRESVFLVAQAATKQAEDAVSRHQGLARDSCS